MRVQALKERLEQLSPEMEVYVSETYEFLCRRSCQCSSAWEEWAPIGQANVVGGVLRLEHHPWRGAERPDPHD